MLPSKQRKMLALGESRASTTSNLRKFTRACSRIFISSLLVVFVSLFYAISDEKIHVLRNLPFVSAESHFTQIRSGLIPPGVSIIFKDCIASIIVLLP